MEDFPRLKEYGIQTKKVTKCLAWLVALINQFKNMLFQNIKDKKRC